MDGTTTMIGDLLVCSAEASSHASDNADWLFDSDSGNGILIGIVLVVAIACFEAIEATVIVYNHHYQHIGYLLLGQQQKELQTTSTTSTNNNSLPSSLSHISQGRKRMGTISTIAKQHS